jgi:hypothetical protein
MGMGTRIGIQRSRDECWVTQRIYVLYHNTDLTSSLKSWVIAELHAACRLLISAHPAFVFFFFFCLRCALVAFSTCNYTYAHLSDHDRLREKGNGCWRTPALTLRTPTIGGVVSFEKESRNSIYGLET